MSPMSVDSYSPMGRGLSEGSKMAGNDALWNDGKLKNADVFGKSGFSALPGGFRHKLGSYVSLGNSTTFWASTENNGNSVWYRAVDYSYSSVARYYYEKTHGFSVRCVMD